MSNLQKTLRVIPVSFRRFILLLLTVFAMFFLFSCKKEQALKQDDQLTATEESSLKTSTERLVHNGYSIQAAIDAASPGDVIRIEPGIYKEAISVSKANIKIAGLTSPAGEGVIIKNPGTEKNGITVTDAADGFSLENVTIKGFGENGILLTGVDNFKLTKVTAIKNGEYGIFPVHCSHGVIKYCSASGHSDTGIYVGQSSDVEMSFNTAFANVSGLEIENSYNVTVVKNLSYNNVAGIFIDLLPGKDVKTASNIFVRENVVLNNNHENFGEEGSLESVIPVGVGILVLGTDDVEIKKNVIKGNNFFGVAVFSTTVLGVLAGVPDSAFADIEPNPDGVRVRENLLLQNGKNPPQLPDPLTIPGVDLLWDGSGTNNCWSKNLFVSSYPYPLPSCN